MRSHPGQNYRPSANGPSVSQRKFDVRHFQRDAPKELRSVAACLAEAGFGTRPFILTTGAGTGPFASAKVKTDAGWYEAAISRSQRTRSFTPSSKQVAPARGRSQFTPPTTGESLWFQRRTMETTAQLPVARKATPTRPSAAQSRDVHSRFLRPRVSLQSCSDELGADRTSTFA